MRHSVTCSELKLTLRGCWLIAIHTGGVLLAVVGRWRLIAVHCRRGTEFERAGFDLLRQILVVIDAEVRLYDVERFLVDVHVLVALQVFDLVQAEAFFDHDRVWILSVGAFGFCGAQFEDILEPIEGHLNDLRVGHTEQFAQRRNDSLIDDVSTKRKRSRWCQNSLHLSRD